VFIFYCFLLSFLVACLWPKKIFSIVLRNL